MSLTKDEIAKEVEKMMAPELQELGNLIEARLPKGWGFALLMFEAGPRGGPVLYASNAERSGVIHTMRKFIERDGKK